MKRVLSRVLMVFVFMVLAIGCTKQVKPDIQAEYDIRVKPDTRARPDITKKEAPTKKTEAVTETIYPVEVAEVIPPIEKSLVEFKDVLFDYDKYDIRPDSIAILDSVALWLKQNRDVNVLIEGHCDERGTNEYNLALGEKRAKAAKDYLTSKGVSPSRIITISYGEEKPTCLDQNEDCWQRNRRARFVITK